jgi:transposase-like protein
MKKSILVFDPDANQLAGPAGVLPVQSTDELARRFLMIVEGQCLHASVADTARKYGCCRQRYYQILATFKQGGLAALQPQKTGPKSNYRRTDQAVKQVLRHRFLDSEASPSVIAQKLCQTQFPISQRSVNRIIAEYGLQKKTLRPQSPKPAPVAAGAKLRQSPTPQARRSRQPGAGSPPTAGR